MAGTHKTSSFVLEPRFYDWVQVNTADRLEKHGHYNHRKWVLDPATVALVLLDVWCISHLHDVTARADQIVRSKIVPLRDTCANHGMHIIHAPSPEFARPYTKDPESAPKGHSVETGWPPEEFLRKCGPHAQFQRYSPEQVKAVEELRHKRAIHPAAMPRDGEMVAASGQELHEICRGKGILVLLYVGFSVNFCMISRDYGMVQMKRRGYETLLVRDCTTGVEADFSTENQTLGNAVITSLEMSQHYTITSGELISSLEC